MFKYCLKCGLEIEYEWWGEWVDNDWVAECYGTDMTLRGRHEPGTYEQWLDLCR